jgi:hypothetical protein
VVIIAFISWFCSVWYYVVSLKLMLYYQSRDLVTFLGVGGLIDNIRDFMIAPIAFMILLANIGALIGANILFLGSLLLIGLISQKISLKLDFEFPDPLLIALWVIFLVIAYIGASIAIYNITKNNQETIISEQNDPIAHVSKVANIFIWARKVKGFTTITTKLARINILRRSHLFFLNLLTFFFLTFLLFSLVFGAFVVRDSTINAMEQGIGINNYAIVNQKLEEFIHEGFLLYSQKDYNYSIESTTFSQNVLKELLEEDNLTNLPIDGRLIINTNVQVRLYLNPTEIHNLTGIDLKQENELAVRPSQYIDMFVIGMSMNSTIAKCQYYNQNPKNLQGNEIAVGEWTAWNIFQDPSRSSILFPDNPTKEFFVKSVIKDPFLKGQAIYVPVDSLNSLFGYNRDDRNVIFIKIDDPALIPKVESKVKKMDQDLILIPLNPILRQNKFTQEILGYLLLVIIVPLIFAFLITGRNYSIHIIEERKDQLRTLKALGASQTDIKDVIEKEIQGLMIWGISLGLLVGYYFIIEVVVPNPLISFTAIVWTFLPLIITVILIFKDLRKQIKKFYLESLY